MPIRATRQRKEDGLKKFIPRLYASPTLKFLKAGAPWENVCDLIYGPSDIFTSPFFNADVRQRSHEKLAMLEALWGEIGADIRAAQRQYRPGEKPWAARYGIGLRQAAGAEVWR